MGNVLRYEQTTGPPGLRLEGPVSFVQQKASCHLHHPHTAVVYRTTAYRRSLANPVRA
jgi:hypothetical protein